MFITLNLHSEAETINNKEIHVNVYSIQDFMRMPDDERTCVTYMGEGNQIHVKQTPLVIENRINKALDLI